MYLMYTFFKYKHKNFCKISVRGKLDTFIEICLCSRTLYNLFFLNQINLNTYIYVYIHTKCIIGRKTMVLIPSNTSFLPVQYQQLRNHIQICMLHFSLFLKPLLVLFFLLFIMAISTTRICRFIIANSRAHLLIYYILHYLIYT